MILRLNVLYTKVCQHSVSTLIVKNNNNSVSRNHFDLKMQPIGCIFLLLLHVLAAVVIMAYNCQGTQKFIINIIRRKVVYTFEERCFNPIKDYLLSFLKIYKPVCTQIYSAY